MKRAILIILLLAVSVAAQSYDKLISINPGTLNVVSTASGDVYGTTWGQCTAVCTNQCLEAKKGSREECDKMCTDQCHPQPDVITRRLPPISMPPVSPIVKPEPRTCDNICAQKFKVCEDSKRGADCKSLFEQCAKSCEPAEPCEVKCKRSATQGGDAFTGGMFDAGLYVECITKRCLVPCKKACAAAYGDASEDCIIKLCQKPTPPQTCEGRCGLIMNDCKAANIDAKSCDLKVMECKRKCSPEKPMCPDNNCEMSCVKEYHGCSARDCGVGLSQCIDGCFGPNDPQVAVRCRNECRYEKIRCLDVGRSGGVCLYDEGICQNNCPALPPGWTPPPLSCRENCFERNLQCREEGRDGFVCSVDLGACTRDCPQSIEPGGTIVEQAPVVSSDDSGAPAGKPLPRDMAGLNPQPEPPKEGFFARMWAGITG